MVVSITTFVARIATDVKVEHLNSETRLKILSYLRYHNTSQDFTFHELHLHTKFLKIYDE